MSCPPDVPIPAPPAPPPPPQKKKSSSFSSTAGLRERNDDSLKLQERIEALLEEQDTYLNSRVQFGLYLTSMIPRIHDSLLVDFLDESHRLLLQYVRQSDIIMLQETQQQQPYHHPHQQPFVSHDIKFQPQAFQPTLQVPKYQQILFHQSLPDQPVSITEVRHVASHQHVVSSLPPNICIVTTFFSSTTSSTTTSGGIFDPSVTLASLVELQQAMPLTPSTSFLSDENVNLDTPKPGSQCDEG